MKEFPTAAQVATLIVTASQLCDLDPLDVMRSRRSTQARYYAFTAIRDIFEVGVASAARMVGIVEPGDANTTFLRTGHTKPWFRPTRLLQVKRSIRPFAVEKRVARHAVAPAQLSPTVPVIRSTPHQQTVTALFMGDPAPGRSALDQRRGVVA